MTLNKNRFYAIKELSTGLFLSYDSVHPQFLPLGERTKLFQNKSYAMSVIEDRYRDIKDLMYWDQREKDTGIDRWHLDANLDEMRNAQSVYEFKVVPVEIYEIL